MRINKINFQIKLKARFLVQNFNELHSKTGFSEGALYSLCKLRRRRRKKKTCTNIFIHNYKFAQGKLAIDIGKTAKFPWRFVERAIKQIE